MRSIAAFILPTKSCVTSAMSSPRLPIALITDAVNVSNAVNIASLASMKRISTEHKKMLWSLPLTRSARQSIFKH